MVVYFILPTNTAIFGSKCVESIPMLVANLDNILEVLQDFANPSLLAAAAKLNSSLTASCNASLVISFTLT